MNGTMAGMDKPLAAEAANRLRLDSRFNRLVAERVVGCHVRQRRGRYRTLYDLIVPGGVDSIDHTTEEGAWSATLSPALHRPQGQRARLRLRQVRRLSGEEFAVKLPLGSACGAIA